MTARHWLEQPWEEQPDVVGVGLKGTQPEVIRTILSEDSPCCEGLHACCPAHLGGACVREQPADPDAKGVRARATVAVLIPVGPDGEAGRVEHQRAVPGRRNLRQPPVRLC